MLVHRPHKTRPPPLFLFIPILSSYIHTRFFHRANVNDDAGITFAQPEWSERPLETHVIRFQFITSQISQFTPSLQ